MKKEPFTNKEEIMSKPIEFDILEIKPDPPLTDKQKKLIYDITDIGQTIEDKEFFKKFLHHLFFKTHIIRPI